MNNRFDGLSKALGAGLGVKADDGEARVMVALRRAAEDASGGQFGFTDEAMTMVPQYSPQQFGGYVTALQHKGLVTVHDGGQYTVRKR